MRCAGSAAAGRSSGSSSTHRLPGTLSTWAQRGWNGQPVGGLSRLGGLPGIGISWASVSAVDVGHAGQQAPGVGHLRVDQDLLARAVLDRAAGVHHQHVVGHLGDHAEVVGDDDDRGVELPLEVLQQVEDLGLHGDVERGGRLVGDQQRRVVDQPHRDHRPLPHAAGELVREVVDPAVGLRDADPVEHLDRLAPGVALGRIRVVHQVGLGQLAADLVERVQRRQRVLEDHRDRVAAQLAHPVLGQADDLGAADPDRAGDLADLASCRPRIAIDGDRLARSGLAHDAQRLAELDACSSGSVTAVTRPSSVGNRTVRSSTTRNGVAGGRRARRRRRRLGEGHESLTLGSRTL